MVASPQGRTLQSETESHGSAGNSRCNRQGMWEPWECRSPGGHKQESASKLRVLGAHGRHPGKGECSQVLKGGQRAFQNVIQHWSQAFTYTFTHSQCLLGHCLLPWILSASMDFPSLPPPHKASGWYGKTTGSLWPEAGMSTRAAWILYSTVPTSLDNSRKRHSNVKVISLLWASVSPLI